MQNQLLHDMYITLKKIGDRRDYESRKLNLNFLFKRTFDYEFVGDILHLLLDTVKFV